MKHRTHPRAHRKAHICGVREKRGNQVWHERAAALLSCAISVLTAATRRWLAKIRRRAHRVDAAPCAIANGGRYAARITASAVRARVGRAVTHAISAAYIRGGTAVAVIASNADAWGPSRVAAASSQRNVTLLTRVARVDVAMVVLNARN